MQNENQPPSVVELGKIGLHKAYTSPVMVENFIQTEFMLATPAIHLTKKAVLTLLELHPVQVMYAEHIRNELFKRSDSPTHLARLFGITRETLRKWKMKAKVPS
jgi:DNA-binding transcriptional regulator YiaG